MRTAPLRNVFTYGTYQWLVDLDDLPRPGPCCGAGRLPGPRSPGRPARRIRANLDRFLATHDVDLGGGRVLMLAHARVLGYVFNPLTVYWCHRADGALACVVAEVHNTYGQRHAYLLRTDRRGRAQTAKEFYVSPFYPVDGRYRMSLPEPGGPAGADHRPDRPGGHRSSPPCTVRPPRHRARPARWRRPPSLADRGRGRADPLAGDPALPSRAARRNPASPSSPGGSSVTRTTSTRPRRTSTPNAGPTSPGGRFPAARRRGPGPVHPRRWRRLPLQVRLPDGRLLGAAGWRARMPRSWSCTGRGRSSAASAPPA